MEKDNSKTNRPSAIDLQARPPVVVVMGHVDHGKSTLLDYIRKTNVVDKEVGGITQRISAYEVVHQNEKGEDQKITFLDTPGHEAFSKMRERGAKIADIAILVVSAEDGVKPQTIEAWKSILEMKLPVIVAINKVDKPGANVEKTKIELAEKEIYLENYGGQVPFVEISAKTGTGIDHLLSLILIITDMEAWQYSTTDSASGFVIEANLDSKRGIQATLLIKNGTLKNGMMVAVGGSTCSARIIENYLSKPVSEATASSPVRIFGFDKMPQVGAEFKSFHNKKDAQECAQNWQDNKKTNAVTTVKDSSLPADEAGKKTIPIILKADVAGSLEALEKEINLIKSDGAEFRIISSGVGPISESDIKNVADSQNAIIVGFNVKSDKSAAETAEKRGIVISFFDIIYKATEWLTQEMENRRPRIETVETTGRVKIIRAFSRTKERQILGGKVTEGSIFLNATVKIMRRDFEIGRGKIVNLEKGKVKTSEVVEGNEFGMMVESKIEIVSGDIIESFSVVQK